MLFLKTHESILDYFCLLNFPEEVQNALSGLHLSVAPVEFLDEKEDVENHVQKDSNWVDQVEGIILGVPKTVCVSLIHCEEWKEANWEPEEFYWK